MRVPGQRFTDEELFAYLDAYRRLRNKTAVARELGLHEKSVRRALKEAAQRGFFLRDSEQPMPGFSVTKLTTDTDADGNINGQFVTQKPEHGEVFEMPKTHILGKVTMNLDAEGRVIQSWPRLEVDKLAKAAFMREAIEALKEEIPRAPPVNTHRLGNEDLLSQYTVTDSHFGMLSWGQETGADYDLKIAEQLLLDWFAMAIRLSPDSRVGVFAQLGDLLHFDSLQSVTPTHGHVLDSDSRFAKIVRVVIRVLRKIITMLLEKHELVHIIMCDANHDPASEIWLREMFSAFYENEPRISVDRNPGSYNAYEWGATGLYYHHGHKRGIKEVDRTWVARNREMFGRTKFGYGHTGHLHSDAVFENKLIKVERHETLAAPSAYETHAGYTSSRSAKVITYSRRFGEVGRTTITPEMVAVG